MTSKPFRLLPPLRALAAGVWLAASAQAQAVHYVPGDYPTIYDAVNAAADGDRVVVSPGVYEEQTMEITGKDIVIESSAGAHATVITPTPNQNFGLENRILSYTEGAKGELRGFTLRGGRARNGLNGSGLGSSGVYDPPTIGEHGGAIFIDNSAPRIENCFFIDNQAGSGGIGHWGGQAESGHDAVFPIGCGANGDDGEMVGGPGARGGSGGAIRFIDGGAGTPLIVNCAFVGNRAGKGGRGGTGEEGGSGGYSGDLSLCDGGDGGDGAGGGVGGDGGYGGAVYGPVDLIGCVFFDNHRGEAGEAGPGGSGGDGGPSYSIYPSFGYGDDGADGPPGTPGSPGAWGGVAFARLVQSCVIWENGPDGSIFTGSSVVSSSLVQDAAALGLSGAIDADPLFVGGQAGEVFDVRFQPGSPCIDSGDMDGAGVTVDLDGNPRLVDDPIASNTGSGSVSYADMGPYEYAPDAPTLADTYVWIEPGASGGGLSLDDPVGTLEAAESTVAFLQSLVDFDPFYDLEAVGLMADSKTAAAGQPTVFTGQATTVSTPMTLQAVGGSVRLQ